MSLAVLTLSASIVLIIAYRIYGRFLAKRFKLDSKAVMPSESQRDDLDYIPTPPNLLLAQHFSAIAAAGPIVGPILAGVMFGWLPALIWILIGSIFIGGVHDIGALVASVRHKAKSIAQVLQEYVSRRAYLLFLSFIWFALVYIIVAFTDITAQSFVGTQVLENGDVITGAGIASSSLMYLILPMVMGVFLRFTKISLGALSLIFLPLILLVIWGGQHVPIDLAAMLSVSEGAAHKVWDVLILGYCLIAGALPVWLLLQPRGYLGGYFLYFFLIVGVLGLLSGSQEIRYPAFTSFVSETGVTLIPFLFITIACGAVSGFHSLIASGTTSKQLRKETDAVGIGYGSMLLEAGVAFIALSSVMVLSPQDPLTSRSPNLIFASGIGNFLSLAGVSQSFAISIMLMAFTTFVYDTLDVCTRLGRYIFQELTGLKGRIGMWLGTSVTALVPLLFVTQSLADSSGNPIPAWRVFWPLFGASNQLLAALTLTGITVWIWSLKREKKEKRERWILFVAGIPAVFMFVMSIWALFSIFIASVSVNDLDLKGGVAALLIVLALFVFLESIKALRNLHGNYSKSVGA